MVYQKRFIFRRTLPDIPIIFFLAVQLLSLIYSIDPQTSLYGYYSRFNGGFLSLASYAVLYWAAATYLDFKSTVSLLQTALWTAIPISLYGIAEHFGIDSKLWVQDVQNRVFSTLGQPNWLASYLIALIFLPLAHIFSHPKTKITRYLIFAILFLTLIYTKSRSGLLAFGISSLVFFAYVFLKKRIGHFSFSKLSVTGLIVILPILIFANPLRDLFISTSPVLTPGKIDGPALDVGGTESGAIRKIVWKGSLDIWRASPKNFWLGSGPETFGLIYYLYRPLEHNHTSEWDLLYNKAHNEFLNYLSTTGILGLSSYLCLLFAFLVQMIRSLSSAPNDSQPLTRLALLVGWLTIPITNFWGFSVVIVQVLMFVIPALTLHLQNQSVSPALPRTKYQTSLFTTAITLGALGVFLYFSLAIFQYWLADTKLASGQNSLRAFTMTQKPEYVALAYQDLQSAFELNPHEPAISAEYAFASAYLSVFTETTDATSSATLSQKTKLLAELTISRSPQNPSTYKQAAKSLTLLGTISPDNFDTAISYLNEAQKLSPTDPRVIHNLGILYKYKGDTLTAQKFFNHALQLKPDYPEPKNQLEQIASEVAKKDFPKR